MLINIIDIIILGLQIYYNTVIYMYTIRNTIYSTIFSFIFSRPKQIREAVREFSRESCLQANIIYVTSICRGVAPRELALLQDGALYAAASRVCAPFFSPPLKTDRFSSAPKCTWFDVPFAQNSAFSPVNMRIFFFTLSLPLPFYPDRKKQKENVFPRSRVVRVALRIFALFTRVF